LADTVSTGEGSAVTDHEGSWSDTAIVDYINEGIGLLQSLRPDAFIKLINLRLTPGVKQVAPEGIDRIAEVLNATDADGNIIGDIQRRSDTALSRLPANVGCSGNPDVTDTCTNAEAYVATSATINDFDPRSFDIYPPPPRNADSYVCVRAVMDPPCFCANRPGEEFDIPVKFHAAIIDWVIHRAYLRDIESTYAIAQSTNAFNRFYTIISNGQTGESKFGSGYFLGAEGSGDPQAKARA
jgi:hypothetical protein